MRTQSLQSWEWPSAPAVASGSGSCGRGHSPPPGGSKQQLLGRQRLLTVLTASLRGAGPVLDGGTRWSRNGGRTNHRKQPVLYQPRAELVCSERRVHFSVKLETFPSDLRRIRRFHPVYTIWQERTRDAPKAPWSSLRCPVPWRPLSNGPSWPCDSGPSIGTTVGFRPLAQAGWRQSGHGPRREAAAASCPSGPTPARRVLLGTLLYPRLPESRSARVERRTGILSLN